MEKIRELKAVQSVDAKVSEYYRLREEKKRIDARMKVLADEIKDYASVHGAKDDKGSSYCDNGAYIFGAQAKKSVSLVQDKAIEFLRSMRLFDAIVTVEKVDEGVLNKYVNEGVVTYEDLESITTTKTTYAIDLKKKEELPVVEETVVQQVASRKSKTSLPTRRRK